MTIEHTVRRFWFCIFLYLAKSGHFWSLFLSPRMLSKVICHLIWSKSWLIAWRVCPWLLTMLTMGLNKPVSYPVGVSFCCIRILSLFLCKFITVPIELRWQIFNLRNQLGFRWCHEVSFDLLDLIQEGFGVGRVSLEIWQKMQTWNQILVVLEGGLFLMPWGSSGIRYWTQGYNSQSCFWSISCWFYWIWNKLRDCEL